MTFEIETEDTEAVGPFGPAYPKINGLYKRDARKVIIPGDYAQEEFDYLQDNLWTWTEKVDGTNVRLYWNGTTVALGGRTDRAAMPTPLVNTLRPLVENTDLWKEAFGEGPVTLYGEGYGEGIQAGGHYLVGKQDFILFDVKVGKWWLKREDCEGIAAKLGIKIVPLFEDMTLCHAAKAVQEGDLKSQLSNNTPLLYPQLEGLVGHPKVELRDRRGSRITAKIKVKDFLDYERRRQQ